MSSNNGNDKARGAHLVGFLAVMALVASATACIFDQGSYKGGGRLDTGSTAEQKDGTSSGSTSGTTPTDDDDDNTPVIDSGSTTGGIDAGGTG